MPPRTRATTEAAHAAAPAAPRARPADTGRKRHITKAEYEAALHEIPLLVDPTDLADIFQVDRASVHQWKNRGVLPEPWRLFGKTPVWRYSTIVAWAEETGRIVVRPR